MSVGMIILIVVMAAFVYIAFHEGKNKPISEEKLEKQKEKYEEILSRFQVPEEHYKIVIGQARAFEVYNCPAILWKEGEKVKLLLLTLNPYVTEHEEADFLYLSAQPYVDFIRFDGTEYPDWAVQSGYVKELFLPYVDLTQSKGGIDYGKNMYWSGIICVYAKSMTQIFKMLNRPMADFDNKVENKKLMEQDGSVPEEMLLQWKEEENAKKAAALFAKPEETKESMENMEHAIRQLRDMERKAGEEAVNSLYARLLADKRFEELEKATGDEEYRKALMEEYQIK